MPQSSFQFKQFTVFHDRCAMKVGTDGVLLGAWAPVDDATRILDVGTGTGLVALMLAQRSQASIVALEIDEAAALQAQENVDRSPWQGRIEVIKADFKHYVTEQKFDLIVSNPPYFSDSLKCPDKQRNAARHDTDLTYLDLLKGVTRVLNPDGLFALVIPADAENQVRELAFTQGLHPVRCLHVITKPENPPKRVLVAFSFHCEGCKSESMVTEIARHRYSDAYIALTKEFYLKM